MRFQFRAMCVLTVCLAIAAHAQSYDDAIDEAQALFHGRIDEGYPGFSAAVAVDGEIVWAEGIGYADVASRSPVTTESKFRIGSVSKPLTAAGLMLLHERGAIDLDAPIQTYVASFPEKAPPFSVRQLAGHIAGIRHYKGPETFSRQFYPTVVEGLAIFQDDPLEFEPGTKHQYSSYGWNLISAAMEKPAGKDFLAYIKEAVFEPLEMNDTDADYANKDIPNRVTFYVGPADEPRVAPMVDNSYKWAGGGFLSTPSDLVRFGSAHFESGFLSEESLETMFTSLKLNNGEETGYGIGWRIQKPDDNGGMLAYQHGGSSVGGRAVLMIFPEEEVVVALLTNVSNYDDGGKDADTLAKLFVDASNEALASAADGK